MKNSSNCPDQKSYGCMAAILKIYFVLLLLNGKAMQLTEPWEEVSERLVDRNK